MSTDLQLLVESTTSTARTHDDDKATSHGRQPAASDAAHVRMGVAHDDDDRTTIEAIVIICRPQVIARVWRKS